MLLYLMHPARCVYRNKVLTRCPLSIQAAGSEEGEVTGRGAIAAGKGEL